MRACQTAACRTHPCTRTHTVPCPPTQKAPSPCKHGACCSSTLVCTRTDAWILITMQHTQAAQGTKLKNQHCVDFSTNIIFKIKKDCRTCMFSSSSSGQRWRSSGMSLGTHSCRVPCHIEGIFEWRVGRCGAIFEQFLSKKFPLAPHRPTFSPTTQRGFHSKILSQASLAINNLAHS